MNNSSSWNNGSAALILIDNNTAQHNTELYNLQQKLIYGSLGAGLAAVITIVNAVILFHFARNRRLRRVPGHLLIVYLMVSSDVMIGATALPGYLVAVLFNYWPLPIWICDVWITCDYISTNISVISVTAVAFDRFLATNFVFAHKRWMHRANQRKLCAALWAFTVLRNCVTFPAWVVVSDYRSTDRSNQCSHPIYSNTTAALVQRTIALYIPVLLLLFFYSAVVFRILSSARGSSGVPSIH